MLNKSTYRLVWGFLALIVSAALPVDVQAQVPDGRTFTLQFSFDDGPLPVARVQAGATTRVSLLLSGATSLGVDETLTVSFDYETQDGSASLDVMVQETTVSFTGNSTRADVTLNAVPAATSGTLTADVESPMNATITPASLQVEILPRVFSLAFLSLFEASRSPGATIPEYGNSPPTNVRDVIEVPVTDAITSLSVSVTVTLLGRQELQIRLVPPNGSTVTLYDRQPDGFRGTWDTASFPELAGLLGADPRGDWTLIVRDLTEFSAAATKTLNEWSLRVGFTPPPRLQVSPGDSIPLRLSLSGVEQLTAGESLPVDLTYTGTGVTVEPATVVFSEDRGESDLKVTVTPAATSGTLTADVKSPMNATITPASLQVEILPRVFSLAFSSLFEASRSPGATIPEYGNSPPTNVRDVIEVPVTDAITSLSVSVTVTLLGRQELQIRLVPPNGSTVTLYDRQPDGFRGTWDTASFPELASLLGADPRGDWTLIVRDLTEFSAAATKTLDEWSLRVGSTPPPRLQVSSGDSIPLRLSLSGVEQLTAGESLPVDLTYTGTGVTVEPATVVFSEDRGESDLKVTVMPAATSGTLTADVESPMNATITPASLQVEVLPRRFRVELERLTTFSYRSTPNLEIRGGGNRLLDAQTRRDTIEVPFDGTLESLSVSISFDGETRPDFIRVIALRAPSGEFVVLHESNSNLRDLRRTYTMSDFPSLSVLEGTGLRGDWALTFGGVMDILLSSSVHFGTLENWGLELTAAGPSTALRVMGAGNVALAARLVGVADELGEPVLGDGEVLEVLFDYAGTGVTLSPARFTSTVTQVLVTLAAAPDATAGALDAALHQVPADVIIEPSALPSVEIVPRPFSVGFSGVFQSRISAPFTAATETFQDTVHASPAIRVPLAGDLASVSVFLSAMSRVLNAWSVNLISPSGTRVVLYRKTQGGFGTLRDTAGTYDLANLPRLAALRGTPVQGDWHLEVVNNSVTEVPVTASWGLQLTTTSPPEPTRVPAGRVTPSTPLSLVLTSETVPGVGVPRLAPDETLPVDFTYTGTGVTVSPEVQVVFSEGRAESDLMLIAAHSATPGTLTATVGTLPNASPIASAQAAIEILPREFMLAFSSTEIGIAPGSTRTVILSLENAERLVAFEQVPVTLTLPGDSNLTLSSTALLFSSSTPTHGVSLGVPVGASPQAQTLHALVPGSHGLPNADFGAHDTNGRPRPGRVPVQVNVLSSRDFTWVFRSAESAAALSTAAVVPGGSREILLSLEDERGALGEGESVGASLSLTNGTGITVTPTELTFTPDASVHSLTLQTEVTATTGQLVVVMLTGTTPTPLPGATTVVMSASLPVEILPRRFRVELERLTALSYRSTPNLEIRGGGNRLLDAQTRSDTIEVPFDGTLESLSVSISFDAVARPHFIRVIALRAPSGEFVVLHESNTNLRDFRRTYTTSDFPALSVLEGTGLRGDWALTFGGVMDVFIGSGVHFGTLENWGIDFTAAAGSSAALRVMGTGNVALAARLVGVAGTAGTPTLGDGEMLEATFDYAGTGVTLSPAPVRFTSTVTQVLVTLAAAPDATAGALDAALHQVPADVIIEPSALPSVEIVPRPFSVGFSGVFQSRISAPFTAATETFQDTVHASPAIRVPLAGDLASVSVFLSAMSRVLNAWSVNLISPSGTRVVLYRKTQGGFGTLRDTAGTYDLANLPRLAALRGTPVQGDWHLEVVNNSVTEVPVTASWGLQLTTTSPPEPTRVPAGRVTPSTPLSLVLTSETVPGVGVPRLAPDETLPVDFTYDDGIGVMVLPAMRAVFSEGRVESDLTLIVARSATSGMLVATPGTLPNASPIAVAQAEIDVSREFTLAFETLEGGSLETARVLAGGTTQVSLSLSGLQPLSAGETLTVNFDYAPRTDGVEVSSPQEVIFTAENTVVDLTLRSETDTLAGTLTARVPDVPANTLPIAPASLPVEVLPRRFRVDLHRLTAFSYRSTPNFTIDRSQPPDTFSALGTIEVPFDGTLESLSVSVSIQFAFGGVSQSARVALIAPSGERVVLHNRTSLFPASVLRRTYDLDNFSALSALTGTGLRGDWVLAGALGIRLSGRPMTLENWGLELTAAAGSSTALRVMGAGNVALAARLESVTDKLGTPTLGDGEVLEVTFDYAGTGVTLSPARFTSIGTLAPVTLAAAPDATVGALSRRGPPSVLIEPSALPPVEIVPRPFSVGFSGVFQSRDVSFVIPRPAGNVRSPPIAVPLAGDLASVSVLVSFSRGLRDEQEFDDIGLISPSGTRVVLRYKVTFGTAPRIDGTYDLANSLPLAALRRTPVQGDWRLDFRRRISGDPHPVTWNLQLTTSPPAPVQVVAGRTASTPLSLVLTGETVPEVGVSRLAPGETLPVDFTYEDGTGVTVSPAMQVVFSEDRVGSDLTLIAARSATSGTLVATAGTLQNALSIASTSVVIEILPREFTLAFSSPDDAPLDAARVFPAGTTQIRLSLLGGDLLGEFETFLVNFVYEMEDGNTGTDVVVREAPVNFSIMGGIAADLTLSAATLESRSGTLTATISGADELPNTLPISPAELMVEVLPRREFALAFQTPEGAPLEMARVLAGGTTRVRLSLLGEVRLVADEALPVSFVYDPPGGGVSIALPMEVTFTAEGAMADLTLRTTLGMLPSTLTANIPGTSPGAASGTIPKDVLPIAPVSLEVNGFGAKLRVRALLEGVFQ